ncbi:hypothetical protein SAMN04488018_105117 [Myroides marinus]|uniref:Uncharacterized protein n=1 Tax=Myroides marinus TaxID=703342 RepID=A0A1H6TRV6_9FLAO|nr:hypothetical protein [Myroides marinus]SEI82788.1 hypothetical protein SAMN04488018_105117 [Myroides marinus]
MNNNYPANLYDYFRANPQDFELRTNMLKKAIWGFITIASIVLIIYPSLIQDGWLVRGLAILIALIGLFNTFVMSSNFYSKKTGGKITGIGTAKFANPPRGTEPYGPGDMRIINMYENEDWNNLTNEKTTHDRPMQLQIEADKEGKVIYLLLCRYFSNADFRGIAPVKIISGADYDKYIARLINLAKN